MCCVSVVYMENKYLQTIDFTAADTGGGGKVCINTPKYQDSQKASYTEATQYTHIRDEKDVTQTHHAGVTRCGGRGGGGAAWLIIVVYMFALLLLRFVMRYKVNVSVVLAHRGGGGCTHRGKMQRGRRMSQGV